MVQPSAPRTPPDTPPRAAVLRYALSEFSEDWVIREDHASPRFAFEAVSPNHHASGEAPWLTIAESAQQAARHARDNERKARESEAEALRRVAELEAKLRGS